MIAIFWAPGQPLKRTRDFGFATIIALAGNLLGWSTTNLLNYEFPRERSIGIVWRFSELVEAKGSSSGSTCRLLSFSSRN